MQSPLPVVAHATKLLLFATLTAGLVSAAGCEGWRAGRDATATRNAPAAQPNTDQPTSTGQPSTGQAAGDKSAATKAAPRRELAPVGQAQPAELREGGVIDGDTIRAVGFDGSVRLLHLDTEELLKDDDLAAARRDWGTYVARRSPEGKQIATYGTFMGNEALEFAREFFDGITEIYVEYESPHRTRDFFGRHLAYVWVKRQGDVVGWLNYNVEAVRAGMSPYYTKYGYSVHYHDAFVQAQQEARDANRGIWAPGARAYPDYDRRLAEWAERADQIRAFRERFEEHPDYVELGTDTTDATLRQRLGERVTVFGSISRYSPRGRPPKLYLAHRNRENVIVVANPPASFASSKIDLRNEDFVYVDGVVSLFRGNPQIELDANSRIHSGRRPPEP